MVSVETYLRRRQRQFVQWAQMPGVKDLLQLLGAGISGFILSAASLGASPQPFAMGLCCALSGWRCLAAGLGSALGYRLFWGAAGIQGMLWAAVGTMIALPLRRHRLSQDMPLLIPSMASFFVSALGLIFQVLWLDESPFGIYALRVGVAAGSTLLFQRREAKRDTLSRWLWGCILTLSLSRIAPLPWLNLGCMTCGILSTAQTFPCAVLSGLGADLAQITPVPMTAVVCLSCFLKFLPWKHPALECLGPGALYLGLMLLQGSWDLSPLPGLVLGSALGLLLPARTPVPPRSSTGYAQVQLELAAGVLAQTQQLLLEAPTAPIDETALLEKAMHRACNGCVLRTECRERENLSTYHLHHPLDFACRKPSRILGELRRGREQLLSLRREKGQRQEYHWALVQQYQFLCEYIQSLCDNLQSAPQRQKPRYRIQVSARSLGKGHVNGDACMAFPGTHCRYYVALCDGMGTGMGAAQQGQSTALLLKKMLTAGLSARQAFRSINSILTLRGQAGMVTLDLAEVELTTGKTRLYKWGAAPSWVLREQEIERIGYATPPPGIGLGGNSETTLRLHLSQGDSLILLSDGADIQEAVLRGKLHFDMPTGDLAATILKFSRNRGEDDATAAVLRLSRITEEAVAK